MNKRTIFTSLLLAVLAAVLSGCATSSGRDFDAKVVDSTIVLGQSTRADVIKLLGEPQNASVNTYRKDSSGAELDAPLIVESLEYSFTSNEPGHPTAEPSLYGARRVGLSLVDGVVVSTRRNSSFKSDATSFDASKINQIKKGVSTEADVFALIGRPSGVAIYPLASQRGGKILFYSYNRFNVATNTSEYKTLMVQLDGNQRVFDFNLNQSSKVHPVAPAPTTVVIPVYIPAVRR